MSRVLRKMLDSILILSSEKSFYGFDWGVMLSEIKDQSEEHSESEKCCWYCDFHSLAFFLSFFQTFSFFSCEGLNETFFHRFTLEACSELSFCRENIVFCGTTVFGLSGLPQGPHIKVECSAGECPRISWNYITEKAFNICSCMPNILLSQH